MVCDDVQCPAGSVCRPVSDEVKSSDVLTSGDGYVCVCESPFSKKGDGCVCSSCPDVCVDRLSLCGEFSRCTDSGNGRDYTCSCEADYTSSRGDGTDCVPTACLDPRQGDCGEHSVCGWAEGAVVCTCKDGFESPNGTGRDCRASSPPPTDAHIIVADVVARIPQAARAPVRLGSAPSSTHWLPDVALDGSGIAYIDDIELFGSRRTICIVQNQGLNGRLKLTCYALPLDAVTLTALAVVYFSDPAPNIIFRDTEGMSYVGNGKVHLISEEYNAVVLIDLTDPALVQPCDSKVCLEAIARGTQAFEIDAKDVPASQIFRIRENWPDTMPSLSGAAVNMGLEGVASVDSHSFFFVFEGDIENAAAPPAIAYARVSRADPAVVHVEPLWRQGTRGYESFLTFFQDEKIVDLAGCHYDRETGALFLLSQVSQRLLQLDMHRYDPEGTLQDVLVADIDRVPVVDETENRAALEGVAFGGNSCVSVSGD